MKCLALWARVYSTALAIIVLIGIANPAAGSTENTAGPGNIAIVVPGNGQLVKGRVRIVTQGKPSGAKQVGFFVDGNRIAMAAAKGRLAKPWNSTAVAPGQHSIQVVAYDASGATVDSALSNVFVKTGVVITSPSNNATLSGAFQVVCQAASTTQRVDLYLDGTYKASGPPYTFNFPAGSLGSGTHTISAVAFGARKKDLGNDSITIAVATPPAPTPTPTVTPTAKPTPAPTSTPSVAPTSQPSSSPTSTPTAAPTSKPSSSPSSTPTAAPSSSASATATAQPTPTSTPSGTAYYIDSSNGSDSNSGTSSNAPWQTLAQVERKLSALKPGDQILLKAGDIWYEQLDLDGAIGAAGNPVVFSSYGSGAKPVIDGSRVRPYCIDAIGGPAEYLTIDGIECRSATEEGVTFRSSGGAMPGIVVQNMYIHNTGPGACCGQTPYDDNTYANQLDFEDWAQGADGVQFLNNVVNNCGGHNCLEVHYDTGAVVVKGNTVGPGCVHGCVDLKGAGNPNSPAIVESNTVTCGASQSLCGHGPGDANPTPAFYFENIYTPYASVIYANNVAYDSGIAFQITGGGCVAGHSPCSNTAKYYNNTAYVPSNGYGLYAWNQGTPTSLDIRNNIFDGGRLGVSSCTIAEDAYNDIGGSQGNAELMLNGSSSLAGLDLLDVNPQYIGITANPPNFALQPSSPLINAGQQGLSDTNDIGAY